jgi:hypothetical protein
MERAYSTEWEYIFRLSIILPVSLSSNKMMPLSWSTNKKKSSANVTPMRGQIDASTSYIIVRSMYCTRDALSSALAS